MKITFLGTSAAVPTLKRNVSALALQFDQTKNWWLFDCGEGTQRQVMRADLSLHSLERIFISHMHADHVLGVAALLATRSLSGATTPVVLHGPFEILAFVKDTMKHTGLGVDFEIKYDNIAKGAIEGNSRLGISGEYSVDAFNVPHSKHTMAFVVTECDRQGSFHADKALELGIKPGPLYKELKEGKIVTLADGREIDGKTLVDPTRKGRKLAVVCDTSNAQAILPTALGCDAMIHEATYAAAEEALARSRGHSTAAQAGRMASRASAKTLLLSHFSPRYDQRAEDGPCIEDLVREAQGEFDGTVLAAKDFMQYAVPSK